MKVISTSEVVCFTDREFSKAVKNQHREELKCLMKEIAYHHKEAEQEVMVCTDLILRFG